MSELTAATDLKSLHLLHQRAKALRDRLDSGPKTLAARAKVLDAKKKVLEDARLALKTKKADIHKRELTAQTARNKVDELRIKLNSVKKNDEYKLITNQIATDNKAISNQEDEILEVMAEAETMAAELAKLEAETKKIVAEYEKLKSEFDSKAEGFQTQLSLLEAAIAASEVIIPENDRERYIRSVKGAGADAFAGVDAAHPSCSGCYLSVTHQSVNEMLIGRSLVYCKTCGRILYIES
jgi:uncharacterized protein